MSHVFQVPADGGNIFTNPFTIKHTKFLTLATSFQKNLTTSKIEEIKNEKYFQSGKIGKLEIGKNNQNNKSPKTG